MLTLYPPIDDVTCHEIVVGGGHVLYVEECGHPQGEAVLFLHGGPGSGCSTDSRRYFDPTHYRIVLVDQRGSGRSRPRGEVDGNDTHTLIRDLNSVRQRLSIERWMLFGGSWGATLAIRYAQIYPLAVSAIILRGTFLARPRDVDWFFGADGAARVFPEAYADFSQPLTNDECSNPIAAYHRRLHGADRNIALNWARSWSEWSRTVTEWTLPRRDGNADTDPDRLLTKTRIETHYAINGYFLVGTPLLDAISRLPLVPITIVHGRRDLVCPCAAAWTLHRAIPRSRLILLDNAGHLAGEPAMVDALVRETDRLRSSRSLSKPTA